MEKVTKKFLNKAGGALFMGVSSVKKVINKREAVFYYQSKKAKKIDEVE